MLMKDKNKQSECKNTHADFQKTGFSGSFRLWTHIWLTQSHSVSNTSPNQRSLKEELNNVLIPDFLQPTTWVWNRHFIELLLTHAPFEPARLVRSSNLFQRTWIITSFYLSLHCPTFVPTLTCHPPISLMLLTNFILFSNPQMLFLSQSIWPLLCCAICTTRSHKGPPTLTSLTEVIQNTI